MSDLCHYIVLKAVICTRIAANEMTKYNMITGEMTAGKWAFM
jgi:hypothetical protein